MQPSYVTVHQASEQDLRPNKPQDEQLEGLSCWQTFMFFIKHAILDVKKRKCHFCLAFCTVFIVVLSTLVIDTITSKGPVIFMKLAEEQAGQIDGVIYSQTDSASNYNDMTGFDDFMNFTRI